MRHSSVSSTNTRRIERALAPSSSIVDCDRNTPIAVLRPFRNCLPPFFVALPNRCSWIWLFGRRRTVVAELSGHHRCDVEREDEDQRLARTPLDRRARQARPDQGHCPSLVSGACQFLLMEWNVVCLRPLLSHAQFPPRRLTYAFIFNLCTHCRYSASTRALSRRRTSRSLKRARRARSKFLVNSTPFLVHTLGNDVINADYHDE